MEKEDVMQKYSHWIVPVLAILVIFQAFIIITQKNQVKVEQVVPKVLPQVVETKESSASLFFSPSGISLKKGEAATFDLYLTPKRGIKLDGMDIALAYDPNILQITEIKTPKLFSIVSQRKENEREGKVYVTFLEETQGGLAISSQVKIMTITVKGKAVGEASMSILTADSGVSTVITESGTSKKLLFDRGDLKAVVY
jgi:hypothetical protein